MTLLAGLLLGIVIGAVIGYLFARGRLADMAGRARAAEERAALIDSQLAERFQALSAEALDASTARFLEMAEGRLSAANANASTELETRRAAVEHLVAPLQETLSRVSEQLRESDAVRGCGHTPRCRNRSTSPGMLPSSSGTRPRLWSPRCGPAGGQGRWGELQLRRVVELAGMSARCDFDEQVSVTTADGVQRPDMVVRLAGGKNIVVDSTRSRWPPTWRPRRRTVTTCGPPG